MQYEALLNENRKSVGLLYTCILVDFYGILAFSIYAVNS